MESVISQRRGFLMTTDALLAFIIVSLASVITHQLLLTNTSYERNNLQSIASDTAILTAKNYGADTSNLLSLTPGNTCIKVLISEYNGASLISSTEKVNTGCPSKERGDIVAAYSSYVQNNRQYLVRVNAWKKEDTT